MNPCSWDVLGDWAVTEPLSGYCPRRFSRDRRDTARTGWYAGAGNIGRVSTASRFRGSLVRTKFSRGGFWNTLTVTEDALVLGRWPLSPIQVKRGETSEVRFRRISLPFWWGTDVTLGRSGPAARYIFRPARARRLRSYLLELGWPVMEDPPITVTFLARRRR